MRTAHLLQRVEHGVVSNAEGTQQVADTTRDVRHAEQQVLGREELVVELCAFLVGFFEEPEGFGCERGVAHRCAGDPWLASEFLVDAPAHGRDVDADALHDAADDALGLVEQTPQHVQRRHLRVAGHARRSLRGRQRVLGLAGELVGIERHQVTFSARNARSPRCATARSRGGIPGEPPAPAIPFRPSTNRRALRARRCASAPSGAAPPEQGCG